MEIALKDNEILFIRQFEEKDFGKIQALNKEEGWTNLAENHLNTKEAWENSNVSYVVETEELGIVGYVRGLTDTRVSLFICELLIEKNYRGLGLGKKIIHYLHNKYPTTRIELLANSSSRSFYEGFGFRTFYGFRKTSQE
ncbi:GNAT family N-acetyltransferase [Alteribacter lacisalsi]|uniref:GNAT family N-acetyltransferase n=1 Tax=Alteribacter lacisalsi TaxID=2045244 RepID=A0A2W0HSR3_9BACI|nr:GNAT family N-acetyltransferase [Alteribacter lacisalsi]PYZ96638.1 GNAT family N-acetyltransferase [Alteribacter lacisalsi]